MSRKTAKKAKSKRAAVVTTPISLPTKEPKTIDNSLAKEPTNVKLEAGTTSKAEVVAETPAKISKSTEAKENNVSITTTVTEVSDKPASSEESSSISVEVNAKLESSEKPELNITETETETVKNKKTPSKTTSKSSDKNKKNSQASATKKITKTANKETTENSRKESPKPDSAKKSTADAGNKFVVQSRGKDYTYDQIVEFCKSAYKGDSRKHVKTIDVYVKPENDGLRAYYVINGKPTGAYIDL